MKLPCTQWTPHRGSDVHSVDSEGSAALCCNHCLIIQWLVQHHKGVVCCRKDEQSTWICELKSKNATFLHHILYCHTLVHCPNLTFFPLKIQVALPFESQLQQICFTMPN